MGKKEYTIDRIVRIAITLGLIFGLITLLGYLSDVLIPFAIAMLLAYLINPLVLFVQKKITNRIWAVFISLAVIFTVIVALSWILIPIIAGEIIHMGQILTNLVNNTDIAQRAADTLPPHIWKTIKGYASQKEIQDLFSTDSLMKLTEAFAQKILPGLWGFISGTASFFLGLLGLSVILLYLVFLLFDYQILKQDWKGLIPHAYRDSVIAFINEFNSAMNRYFRAQALVAFIVGVLFSIGFSIIALPMGIVLGLFIGLLNMVPYLQLLGVIPAFLLALVHALETGAGIWTMFGLTGSVFVIVQIIQDAFLVPKIMGRVTGLSPAMILLSLSIWGKLLGLFGLIIALPATCLILAYYKRFLDLHAHAHI